MEKSQKVEEFALHKSLKQSDLKVGDKVNYKAPHDDSEYENGRVKKIPEYTTDSVLVVYHCDDEWHRYQDYTACLTYLKDLELGWK